MNTARSTHAEAAAAPAPAPPHIHHGNLVIRTKADAARYANVEEVTGYLDIRADAQLPVLASVGGSLYIRADAQLPVLASVGGYPSTLPPIVITEHQWLINILDEHMTIGCQKHSLAAWAAFSPREIAAMEGREEGAKFWGQHGRQLLERAAAEGRVFAMPAAEAA